MGRSRSYLGKEANGWHAFMTDQTDYVLLFELHQSVSELSLLDLLWFADEASFSLWNQVVIQVDILDAWLGHFVTEIFLDSLDVIADDLDAGIGCKWDTCRDNVHINLTSLWIGCWLLHGCLNQADTLLNILLFNSVAEAHLGEGLCDTDERLELTRRGCDCLSRVSHWTHALILLDKYIDGLVGNNWLDTSTSVWDVLGQEVSWGLICSDKIGSLNTVIFWGHTLIRRRRVQADNMVSEASIRSLSLFV